MPLQVLPAGEADMYRSAVIEHTAYSALEANHVLFPGPLPPDILKYRAEDFKKEAEDPRTFWYKVVDTEIEDNEQSLAFAKWYTTSEPAILCRMSANDPSKGLCTTSAILAGRSLRGNFHQAQMLRRANCCSVPCQR